MATYQTQTNNDVLEQEDITAWFSDHDFYIPALLCEANLTIQA